MSGSETRKIVRMGGPRRVVPGSERGPWISTGVFGINIPTPDNPDKNIVVETDNPFRVIAIPFTFLLYWPARGLYNLSQYI